MVLIKALCLSFLCRQLLNRVFAGKVIRGSSILPSLPTLQISFFFYLQLFLFITLVNLLHLFNLGLKHRLPLLPNILFPIAGFFFFLTWFIWHLCIMKPYLLILFSIKLLSTNLWSQNICSKQTWNKKFIIEFLSQSFT